MKISCKKDVPNSGRVLHFTWNETNATGILEILHI